MFWRRLQVPASGSFQLQLMSFVVNSWRTSDGQCCAAGDPGSTAGTCRSPCRTFFRLCLSHYQANLQLADVDLDLMCTFGNFTTPVVNASVLLAASSHTSSSTSSVVFVTVPAQMQFDFTWPVSVPYMLYIPLRMTKKILRIKCYVNQTYTSFAYSIHAHSAAKLIKIRSRYLLQCNLLRLK